MGAHCCIARRVKVGGCGGSSRCSWGSAVHIDPDATRTPEGESPSAITSLARASVHLHQPLIAEHDLLIGGQDQRLIAGNEMRLGADVATGFEEAWRPINSGCSVPRARCRRS
jgi:hypothetical protein